MFKENQKRELLKSYAEKFNTRIFVETGTYKGDTVKAMLLSGLFDRIYTVEIYEDRVLRARSRFSSFANIHCYSGDSAEVLPNILSEIDRPALFWLDAHHSGKQIARKKGLIETPIESELSSILKHGLSSRHVIIIDDARYYEDFPKKYPNYPHTEVLRNLILNAHPDWQFEIRDDIIRAHGRLDEP